MEDLEQLNEFRRMPAETEWLEFKEAKTQFDTDDLGRYVTAISNEANLCGQAAGWLIFGVKDQVGPGTKTRAVVGSSYAATTAAINELKRQIYSFTAPALGLSDPVEMAHPDCPHGTRILMWRIPPAAAGMPVAWKGHYFARSGEAMGAMPLNKLDALRAQADLKDWSAALVPNARLQDIDPAALAVAREKFTASNNAKPWAQEISDWSDAVFLNKARLSIDGVLTRAALLLLGRAECVHLLSPHPAEIAWKLPAKRVILSYGPPFLLNVNEVLGNIRRHNVKLFPSDQLIATEVANYDTRVILEALNNCIAHQDYERHARVLVHECDSHLEFESEGSFFDGAPADYYGHNRTPNRYRNKYLSDAMRELGLIDRGGFGINDMYSRQKARFLPLPDYELSQPMKVVVRVFGQTIDENYARLLMERVDLPLEQTIWLDRVQKKYAITNAHAAVLRKAKLLEGRKPNFFVSAQIADATDTRAEYSRNKGLDDKYYKTFVLQHIEKFKSVSMAEIRALLFGKLPDSLTEQQKLAKVKNLLSSLRMQGHNGQKIVATSPGKGAKWSILKT